MRHTLSIHIYGIYNIEYIIMDAIAGFGNVRIHIEYIIPWML